MSWIGTSACALDVGPRKNERPPSPAGGSSSLTQKHRPPPLGQSALASTTGPFQAPPGGDGCEASRSLISFSAKKARGRQLAASGVRFARALQLRASDAAVVARGWCGRLPPAPGPPSVRDPRGQREG